MKRAVLLVLGVAALFCVAGAARAAGQDHGPDEHAGEHGALAASHEIGHGHVPHWEDVNWYEGMLGESAEEPPGILWRAPGTPVPVAALLLNSAILFFLLYRFAKKPIANGLAARKAAILRGMDDAAKMKRQAEARLKDYEEKLAHIDDEVARVHRELRETGEHERARILEEAKERRERMEREAHVLIEQELKAWREILFRETVRGAVRSAESAVTSKVNAADQQRLAEEYLGGLKTAASSLRGRV